MPKGPEIIVVATASDSMVSVVSYLHVELAKGTVRTLRGKSMTVALCQERNLFFCAGSDE